MCCLVTWPEQEKLPAETDTPEVLYVGAALKLDFPRDVGPQAQIKPRALSARSARIELYDPAFNVQLTTGLGLPHLPRTSEESLHATGGSWGGTQGLERGES